MAIAASRLGRAKGWPELVSSYGIDFGDDFVLFDPLSVPDQLRERATAVVLTAPYHERDARRLGLPVHTPPADTWQDWVEKFGIDPDRVRGMESEDLAWLRAGDGEGHFHCPGAWPFGITAHAGREDNDLILWLPSIGAIVTGDSLSDLGDGLDIWIADRKHVTRDDVVQRLRPLLDLPVELVLPAHGEPTDRAALSAFFPELRRLAERRHHVRASRRPRCLCVGFAEPTRICTGTSLVVA